MLFQIRCECGHTGLVGSLPRRACCSACGATRLFRIDDGEPILVKLAAEAERREQRERSPA